MKKVLVTGGAGFIAGHTIEYLKDNGVEVVTNIRSSVIPAHLEGIEVYQVDSRDFTGMRAIIEKVDGVINLAGMLGTKNVKDWREFYDNNVYGAWSVIEACSSFGTPLVQIAVGNHFEHNLYSNTRTAIERDVLMMAKYGGLKANVVRGLNAYGERQKVKNTGKIIPTFITQALKNEPITVYGGKDQCGIMDMIYVKDLAAVLGEVLAFTQRNEDYGNVFEAGTGLGFSVYELALLVKKLTGSESVIVETDMREGESLRSRVVAENPYPYSYEGIESGLEKTIKYYRGICK